MAKRFEADDRAPIGALFSRLLDDAQRLARAEIKLVKETATLRASRSAVAIGLLFGAVMLAQACITVFLVGILIWLARMIGPIGATLSVTLVGLGVCGLIAKIAIGKITAALTMPIPPTLESVK